MQYQHDQEIGTVARLATTSRIAAHRSAIKLDFSISHDRNSVLILCIIVVAVFLSRVVDLGTVTRPPGNIYARVNCSVIRVRCTRVQRHPRNLFRRPWIFRLSSLKHHTWPYHASILWKLLFSNAAAKIPKAISQKLDDGFFFLNDEILDKCLSKKNIRLATPALWFISFHFISFHCIYFTRIAEK